MKKFVNKIDNMLVESLQGFQAAHQAIIKLSLEPTYLSRVGAPIQGKVALVSGGGSGHEPLHGGYVGKGMLDAACPGEIFTSPTPDQILAAAEAVDGGKGVLFIVKNYSGDLMNFEMAADMFGGESASVITNDDVAVENSLHSQGRRGVAATLIVEKLVGAAAEQGASLKECHALAARVNESSGSIGVALTSCTVPAAGKPTFDISAKDIEFGIGIHGEPGRARSALKDAKSLVEDMVAAIVDSLSPKGEIILLVNGMGGTPLLELYLVFDAAVKACTQHNLIIARSLVGNYCTSLEMQGCSITITAVDKELLSLWDQPVHTAALKW